MQWVTGIIGYMPVISKNFCNCQHLRGSCVFSNNEGIMINSLSQLQYLAYPNNLGSLANNSPSSLQKKLPLK